MEDKKAESNVIFIKRRGYEPLKITDVPLKVKVKKVSVDDSFWD